MQGLVAGLGALVGDAVTAPDGLQSLQHRFDGDGHALQNAGGFGAPILEDRQEEMLDGDIGVAEALSHLPGLVENALRLRRYVDLLGGATAGNLWT